IDSVTFNTTGNQTLPPTLGNNSPRRDGGVRRSRRPRGDDASWARGNAVAARHISDGDGDNLPFFVHNLRRLLAG
ncbi:unnamed protein product, partial [Urochloa humidicola]